MVRQSFPADKTRPSYILPKAVLFGRLHVFRRHLRQILRDTVVFPGNIMCHVFKYTQSLPKLRGPVVIYTLFPLVSFLRHFQPIFVILSPFAAITMRFWQDRSR